MVDRLQNGKQDGIDNEEYGLAHVGLRFGKMAADEEGLSSLCRVARLRVLGGCSDKYLLSASGGRRDRCRYQLGWRPTSRTTRSGKRILLRR